MDKIKIAVAWAKKNGFWLGAGFLALAQVVCWIVVAGMIDDSREKYTSEVKSKIQQANAIMNVAAEEGVRTHPNTATEQGMRQLLSQSADEIIQAWKLRYDAQANILQWPQEIQADQKFLDHFNVHNPPETYPGESERGIESYSLLYMNQIPRQMERICKNVLKAKWKYDPQYTRADYNVSTEEELSRFAVVWDETNQDLWYSKLTRFEGYDDHAGSMKGPTGLQIYMLQQDLWLLEAMFEVIRKINGDVSANDLAKIKRIDHLVFGREANLRLGQLTPLAGSGTANLVATPPDAEVTPTTFDPRASRKPFHGRYVDAAFNPISADDVQKVLQAVKKGEMLPDSKLELIVAKRVPVRIALRMDEREIPNFMTACANSPFAFEIHQVRKNRHVAGEGIVLNGSNSTGRGASPDVRGGRGSSPNMGDMSAAQGRGGGRGAAAPGGATAGSNRGDNSSPTAGVETRTNYDVDVEFFGIVKIYNPVSENYFRKVIESNGAQASLEPKRSVNGDRTQIVLLGMNQRVR